MTLPNVYIVLGTLLIAGGGLLATYGWNSRSDMDKRNAIIKAVANEYLIYEAVILDKKIAETNEEELSKFVVYPRFHTTALESIVSSGLFMEDDKELYTRAVNLHELLHELNTHFEFIENEMRACERSIKEIRTIVRDGKTRKSVMLKIEKFGDLLERKYRVNFKENIFVPLDEDAT